MPFAIVVIENRFAVACDQQVVITVVVIVRRCNGYGIHIGVETRLFGHVGEVAVSIVAIEMIVRRRGRLLFQRIWMHRVVERASVHHVKRLQAGVVVVEPDAASAGSFEQRAQLPRTEAMRKVDARLVACVFKFDY